MCASRISIGELDGGGLSTARMTSMTPKWPQMTSRGHQRSPEVTVAVSDVTLSEYRNEYRSFSNPSSNPRS